MRKQAGRSMSKPRETRALDEHIKNLPKGQMEILMTDDTRGTLHAHLHVRTPSGRHEFLTSNLNCIPG